MKMMPRDVTVKPMPGDVLRVKNRDGKKQDWRITHVSGHDPKTGEGTNGVDMLLANGKGLPHWCSFSGYQSRPWSVFARGAGIIHHAGGKFTIKNVKRRIS